MSPFRKAIAGIAVRPPRGAAGTRRRKLLRPLIAVMSLGLVVTGFGPAPAAQAAIGVAGPLTQYVNPFVGTLNNGNTYPGAAMPFGMIQFSPDNGHGMGYAYNNTNLQGFGMVHLSGVGCNLGGFLPQLARVGVPTSTAWTNAGYRVPLATPLHSAENEEAHPGYYRVKSGSGANIVQSELTATDRTGVARYTFPATAGSDAQVLINAGYALNTTTPVETSTTIVDDRTVLTQTKLSGFCQATEPFTVYAKTVFDRPFEASTSTTWAGATIPSTPELTNTAARTGAMLSFNVTSDQDVVAQTSLSYVDANGAAANLAAESVNGNFDQARATADTAWDNRLHTIEITPAEGFGDPGHANHTTAVDQVRSFYSALYRSFLAPNISEDVDGRYRGWGTGIDTVHNISTEGLKHYYQNFSLWDTYRTQEQFLAMVFPKEASDQVKSLVLHGEQGGWAPRWTYGPVETNIMTGDPVTVFLSSAYDQGLLDGAWAERAYQMLKPSMDGIPASTTPYNGRQGNPHYIPYGVVPLWTAAPKKAGDFDYDHGPSSTLEYTLADGMFARMAAALGHSADAERYAQRGQNYKAMWDPEFNYKYTFSGMTAEGAFNARTTTGAFWPTNSLVTQEARFHEGTEPQYEFLATHDMPGVIELMGGKEKAIQRLDNMFRYEDLLRDPQATATCGWISNCTGGSMTYYGYGYYNPNNEPDIQNPFAYTWLGQPWKTADIVDATKYLYRPIPEGMTGNDDLGTMSGWQVLSSIGLFPLAPGADLWGITTPAFSAVDVKLDTSFYTGSSGKLEIRANDRSSQVHYIQSMKFNGGTYDKAYLTGKQLLSGAGTLTYQVGNTPSSWATGADANPGTIAPRPSAYEDRVSLNAPALVSANPGDTVTASPDLLVQGSGGVDVTLTAEATSPLKVTGLSSTTTAPANGALGHYRPAVTIKVPADTPAGVYTVASIRAWDQTQVAIKVSVGKNSWHSALATGNSIASAGSGAADADGAGHYLLDSSLAAAGFTPGAQSSVTVSSQQLNFTIPKTADGDPDTILAAGQTLDVQAGLAGANYVALVGFAVGTTSTVSINPTITFTDDTTVAMGARTLRGWEATSTSSRLVALKERGAGTAVEAIGPSLYYSTAYAVPAGKSIKSLTMPTVAGARILAIARDGSPATPQLVSEVGVDGVLNFGETLTGPAAEWNISGVTTTYQWYRNGLLIPGANAVDYTVVEEDLGAKLTRGVIGDAVGYQRAYFVSPALAIPARPEATKKPSFAGTVGIGQGLVANPGTWDVKGLTFEYQWLLDGAPILTADTKNYTVKSSDVGKQLSVQVTASKAGLPDGKAVSAATMVAKTFSSTQAPTISGGSRPGQVLTASPGSWEPKPDAFSYQWLRDGVAIKGATESSYSVANADAGRKVSVAVTASKTGYVAVSEKSPSVTIAGDLATMKVTKAPSFSGTMKVGKTLTAKPGSWQPSTVKVSYRWLRDGAAISGATKSSYKLAKADAGRKITVAVTGKLIGYFDLTKKPAAKTVAKVAAKVKVALASSVSKSKRASAKITVTAPVGSPTGTVKVTIGSKKVTVKLTASDKGKVTIKLPTLKKGTHKVKVSFTPTSQTAVSTLKSKTISKTLRVR